MHDNRINAAAPAYIALTMCEGAAFMFLFTVTKPGLRQAGALALCAVCLCGTVAAAVHFTGGAVTVSAAAVPGIETTQDIGTYFTGYGFDTDLASAAVDKVKIPKKWDDSFTAFNQIVQESGLDLADYKGKTVEKWTVLCPQLSTGDHDTYCVLLVYKAKAVGAYLLQKPSGEVTGLVTAAKASADAALEEGETVEISEGRVRLATHLEGNIGNAAPPSVRFADSFSRRRSLLRIFKHPLLPRQCEHRTAQQQHGGVAGQVDDLALHVAVGQHRDQAQTRTTMTGPVR